MAELIPEPTPTPDPAPAVTPPVDPSGGQAQTPPAEGEKPSWIPDDAWDADAKAPKLDALEQAFANANKDTDIPASVDAYAPPAIEGLEPDAIKSNPAFKAFAKQALAAGMGQAKFETFVKDWIDEAMATETASAGEVKAALGEKADERLQALSNGMAGKLTAEEHAAIRQEMTNPLVITALEKLLQGGGTSPAPRTVDVAKAVETEEEIKALMQTDAYTGANNKPRDPAIVKKVEDWFKAKYPNA